MAVITLSRQYGSGAPDVANRLCQELGLIAFDKRLMVRVASEIGVSEREIVDYSEDTYKLRGFIDALFGRSRPVAEVSTWTGGGREGYEREVMALDESRAIDLVRATVTAACERGNVVILGRGSQVILEGKPGVFHVRLIAPVEDRISRLQAQQNLTAAQARRLLAERDRATAEYLRTFYNADVDDPTLYHAVLNTSALGVEGCVSLIKAGVELLRA